MLSGIGPRNVLEPLGIPRKVELPGVGKNLQDRYEVGVVNRMSFERWNILEESVFQGLKYTLQTETGQAADPRACLKTMGQP